MVRYPHSITITWQGDPVKDEETGAYTAGATVTHSDIACNCSQNTKGRKIGAPDGQMIDYATEVIMPRQTWKAPFGAKAVITHDDGSVQSTEIKGMYNYQSHSVVWL